MATFPAPANDNTEDIDLALLRAAEENDVERMKRLLKQNANINVRGSNNDTPLISASRLGNAEAVALLIEKKADTSMVNDIGQTALNAALRDHAPEKVIRSLITAGSPLDLKDKWHRAAAYYAAQDNLPGIMRALAENKADLKIANEDGITPLIHATRLPDHRDVIAVLLEFDPGINQPTEKKETALMFAVVSKDAKLVANYIAKGANPLQQDESGMSALDFAKAAGDAATIAVVQEAIGKLYAPLGTGHENEVAAPGRAAFKKKIPAL